MCPAKFKGPSAAGVIDDQCGNFSVRKTADIVRKRFYWFGHTADIEL